MPLKAGLERVLGEYPSAVRESLTAHPVAELIRGPLADELQQEVGPTYLVTGSPGQGNWAATPWISVFERSITTTAQRGFYLVYLFRGDGAAVYLSLNQGTTEVYNRVGGGQYRQVLANQAAVDAGLLRPQGINDLQVGSLDLPGQGISPGVTTPATSAPADTTVQPYPAMLNCLVLQPEFPELLARPAMDRSRSEPNSNSGRSPRPADASRPTRPQ